MSLYRIKHPSLSIKVGYNQSLRTFFASITNEQQNLTILQVGTNHDEIRDISTLQYHLKDHIGIPYYIYLRLQDDAADDGLEPSFIEKLIKHYSS